MAVRLDEAEKTETKATQGYGFACGQFLRASKAISAATSPEEAKRFSERCSYWQVILEGMETGTVQVGSRTPTGLPVWVTPKVAYGGFIVPGVHMAGGSLTEHELEMCKRLGVSETSKDVRQRLNEYFAETAEGLSELEEMYFSGHYRCKTAEEGALLSIAALLSKPNRSKDSEKEAQALAKEIKPWFSELRFFPQPAEKSLPDGTEISVVTISDLRQTLKSLVKRGNTVSGGRYSQMRCSILEVTPLYDSLITLAMETLEDTADRPMLHGDGTVSGGYPFQQYPEGWFERARLKLRQLSQLSVPKSQGNLKRLVEVLEHATPVGVYDVRDSMRKGKLTGRDVCFVRHLLAQLNASRGLPGDPSYHRLRQAQCAAVRYMTHAQLAAALISKLNPLPQDEGLDDELFATLADDQPKALQKRLLRAKRAPLNELIEAGVIKSADQLGSLASPLVAEVSAAGHKDPSMRRLDSSLYKAFRARRSLLLLNLASQIKFEEIPWAKAIVAHRVRATNSELIAASELCEVALRKFPQTILPNAFITEVQTLLNGELHLTKEIAADIFEGAFSKPFEEASKQAWSLVQDTCYARYFALTKKDYNPSMSLVERCTQRADVRDRSVAANGKVIEWQQIMTTHNLASLFQNLSLKEKLKPHLLEMAIQCWSFIVQRLDRLPSGRENWRRRLQSAKNMSYALRQMLFYLSMLPEDEAVEPFLKVAAAMAADHKSKAVRTKLEKDVLPRIRGALGAGKISGNPMLAWVQGDHPLLKNL